MKTTAGRVARLMLASFFLHGILSLPSLALAATPEDAPTDWIVQPIKPDSEEHRPLIESFVARAVPMRIPELEFLGTRRHGALAFGLRAGADPARAATIADELARVPGVMGAMPLPSEREVVLKRARTLAKGGLEAMASGLIVKYHGQEKRLAAKSAQALPRVAIDRLARSAGVELVEARPMSGESYVVDFAAPIGLDAAELAARRVELDPEVDYATPNGYVSEQLVPNDTLFSTQWSLSAAQGINVPAAWDLTTGSSAIRIAIVDTGILAVTDFTGRIVAGYDFVTDPVSGNDGNGRDANATDAGNFRVAGQCGLPAKNSNWHGTHVAGTAAATGNNGSGIAGVNWVSPIVPVRVLGGCGGTDADVLDGLRWAAGLAVPGVPNNPNPARVINMSLGGPGNCITQKTAYFSAVLEALLQGSTVVVAAGNDNESALVNVPASCIGTVKVSAVNRAGSKTTYSNYSRAIEIAAPGGETHVREADAIVSYIGSGLQGDPVGAITRGYQGTSMAAPHVAGVASLMLSARPTLTVAQVRDILRATRRPFPAGSSCLATNDCGLGIVDAAAAVSLAQRVTALTNYSDLYFNPVEDGWGVNFMHTGNVLFGTWFTYGANGQPTWFVMPGLTRVAQDFFLGDVYATTGRPLAQINGQRASNPAVKVGQAVVAYFGVGYDLNPNLGYDSTIFEYNINGVTGSKALGRQIFRSFTSCGSVSGSRAAATNYQDLWWNPAEDGWGINFTHQGDVIFATWFTYGNDTQPLWLVGPGIQRTTGNTFTGKLYQTRGIPFNQINGTVAVQGSSEVGTLTLTFSSGENVRMDYVVNGVPGSKNLVRQPITLPATVCQSGS